MLNLLSKEKYYDEKISIILLIGLSLILGVSFLIIKLQIFSVSYILGISSGIYAALGFKKSNLESNLTRG